MLPLAATQVTTQAEWLTDIGVVLSALAFIPFLLGTKTLRSGLAHFRLRLQRLQRSAVEPPSIVGSGTVELGGAVMKVPPTFAQGTLTVSGRTVEQRLGHLENVVEKHDHHGTLKSIAALQAEAERLSAEDKRLRVEGDRMRTEVEDAISDIEAEATVSGRWYIAGLIVGLTGAGLQVWARFV